VGLPNGEAGCPKGEAGCPKGDARFPKENGVAHPGEPGPAEAPFALLVSASSLRGAIGLTPEKPKRSLIAAGFDFAAPCLMAT
jgi:hypothetical protein